MKINNLLKITLLSALMIMVASCEDAYNPYPEFETVPHSLAKFKSGSPTSFLFGNNASMLEGDLQWITTDGKVKVVETDYYITWSESYLDKDGLPKTANHGKMKLKNTTDVGNQREAKSWSFTAADVYSVFKDAKFDYGDSVGLRSVFGNPKDGDRSDKKYFTSNDKFTLTWGFKADDGRYFDTWSQGICSETVGSNCSLSFGVICVSNIAGTYTSTTTGTSTDDCCPTESTVTSEVTITSLGSGKYVISDFSAGLYQYWYEVYGIDSAYTSSTDKTKNKLIGDILDACDKISGAWVEPFAEPMKISGFSSPDLGVITYSWENGYGDKATVTLTKK